MNIQFDILHAILGALCVILLIVALRKKSPEVATPVAPSAPATPEPAPQAKLQQSNPDSALQLLALLQQDARFIDFIREDLTGFSDADIGAAARVLHEGSQKVLNNYFKLEPVRTETEESRISLPAGFDASSVRLTGNVVGNPPFNGTLVHRGWQVTDVKLPKLAEGHNSRIIAPAEVEL